MTYYSFWKRCLVVIQFFAGSCLKLCISSICNSWCLFKKSCTFHDCRIFLNFLSSGLRFFVSMISLNIKFIACWYIYLFVVDIYINNLQNKWHEQSKTHKLKDIEIVYAVHEGRYELGCYFHLKWKVERCEINVQ